MKLRLICHRVLSEDVGRDFARIPEKIMRQKNIEYDGYVKIKGRRSAQVVKVRPLKGLNEDIITIPTHIVENLGVKYGEYVDISVLEARSDTFTVRPAYRADVGYNVIRIHKERMKSLGLKDGDFVEVRNINKDAGRLIMKVKPLKYGEQDNIARIDGHTRELLNVNDNDVICIRELILPKPTESFIDKITSSIVGTKRITLTVLKGEHIDEGKGIFRCHKDVLLTLGIKEGQFVKVRWLNRTIKGKALKLKEKSPNLEGYRDKLQTVIQICSTERSRLFVDIFDKVEVMRDPVKTLLINIDRLIAASLTTLGFYVMTTTQLPLNPLLILPITILVGIILTFVFFMRVRSEVW